jgi:hypothetical protein
MELTDEQWTAIRPHIPDQEREIANGKRGRPMA